MKVSKYAVLGVVGLVAASAALASSGTDNRVKKEKEADLVCKLFPDYCTVQPNGSGNGGGSEPPM